jgi:hypothetical protein
MGVRLRGTPQCQTAIEPLWPVDAVTGDRQRNRIYRASLAVLLRHTKIENTVRYLGIEVDDALAIAEPVDV